MKIKVKKLVLYISLSFGAILSLYPLYFMFVAATRASGDIFLYPPPFSFGNHFFKNMESLQQRIPIWSAFFNSLKVASLATVLNLLVCSMAAYGLAKFKFKGRNIIFTFILLMLMLPNYARLIPLYRMMGALKLQNTHLAVFLPDIASAFGIFLLRQNFHAVPDALIESARIDGAGEWRIFIRIVMPLMVPALSALGIFIFMGQWGNFTWPLIILNSESQYTLPVALSVLKGDTRIDYGQIMAGAMFAVVPIIIVFLILQKRFIAGLTGGAVKE